MRTDLKSDILCGLPLLGQMFFICTLEILRGKVVVFESCVCMLLLTGWSFVCFGFALVCCGRLIFFLFPNVYRGHERRMQSK